MESEPIAPLSTNSDVNDFSAKCGEYGMDSLCDGLNRLFEGLGKQAYFTAHGPQMLVESPEGCGTLSPVKTSQQPYFGVCITPSGAFQGFAGWKFRQWKGGAMAHSLAIMGPEAEFPVENREAEAQSRDVLIGALEGNVSHLALGAVRKNGA